MSQSSRSARQRVTTPIGLTGNCPQNGNRYVSVRSRSESHPAVVMIHDSHCFCYRLSNGLEGKESVDSRSTCQGNKRRPGQISRKRLGRSLDRVNRSRNRKYHRDTTTCCRSTVWDRRKIQRGRWSSNHRWGHCSRARCNSCRCRRDRWLRIRNRTFRRCTNPRGRSIPKEVVRNLSRKNDDRGTFRRRIHSRIDRCIPHRHSRDRGFHSHNRIDRRRRISTDRRSILESRRGTTGFRLHRSSRHSLRYCSQLRYNLVHHSRDRGFHIRSGIDSHPGNPPDRIAMPVEHIWPMRFHRSSSCKFRRSSLLRYSPTRHSPDRVLRIRNRNDRRCTAKVRRTRECPRMDTKRARRRSVRKQGRCSPVWRNCRCSNPDRWLHSRSRKFRLRRTTGSNSTALPTSTQSRKIRRSSNCNLGRNSRPLCSLCPYSPDRGFRSRNRTGRRHSTTRCSSTFRPCTTSR